MSESSDVVILCDLTQFLEFHSTVTPSLKVSKEFLNEIREVASRISFGGKHGRTQFDFKKFMEEFVTICCKYYKDSYYVYDYVPHITDYLVRSIGVSKC